MWERVSLEPLAFVWRDFASRAECEGLVARAAAARDFTVASGCQMTYGVEGFRRVMQLNGKTYAEVADDGEVEDDLEPAAASLVRRFDEVVAKLLGTLPGTSQHSMQRVVHCTPRMEGAPAGLLNGLHVDTYNDEPRRYATSLLYLRGIDVGGETLFATHEAGESLLAQGVESTIADGGSEGDKRMLESACRSLVPPSQGTLLLFFVRGADGHVDPAAFHGSARPLSEDKWTLQTFWAAPVGARPVEFACSAHAHAFSNESVRLSE